MALLTANDTSTEAFPELAEASVFQFKGLAVCAVDAYEEPEYLKLYKGFVNVPLAVPFNEIVLVDVLVLNFTAVFAVAVVISALSALLRMVTVGVPIVIDDTENVAPESFQLVTVAPPDGLAYPLKVVAVNSLE